MSDSAQTRRSFIKDSMAKSLIAANAGIVAGLINTPGVAGANTTGPGTTQPSTTFNEFWETCTWKLKKTVATSAQSTKHTAAELAAINAAYVLANPWGQAQTGNPPAGLIVSGPVFDGNIQPPYTVSASRNPDPPTPTSILDANGLWYVVYYYEFIHTQTHTEPQPD
jgi:hypothetical protein